jgi:glyoxylase-like metal-dependent hydrolase (beta-lactamase superfamily II)
MIMGSAPAELLPPTLRFIERDWLSANHVLGLDADGATLIDTGYAKHAELTLRLMDHALQGSAHPGLKRIVNTHLHSDHCGGNALLKAHYGCEIVITAAEWNSVMNWDPQSLSFVSTGQRCERFVPDSAYQPGDWLHFGEIDWQVLAAPGHDPHSTILYSPDEKILISADALWENGFGITFPELIGQSGFAEQAAVLDLIETLDVNLVIPGHGSMFTDVSGALIRARSRLQAMREPALRNCRAVLKVLMKFALLDEERMHLPSLAQRFSHAAYIVGAAQSLGMTLDEAMRWSVAELVRQGEVRMEGDWVVN